MRSISACAALSLLAVTAAVSHADDTPPTDLHFVAGHWTAWQPPSSIPPGTPVHVVVAGDTLWDLAASNLGNPYLWPQIWEKNRYVLDAHWIYPGDPILLGITVEPLEGSELGGAAGTGRGAGAGPGGSNRGGSPTRELGGGEASASGVPVNGRPGGSPSEYGDPVDGLGGEPVSEYGVPASRPGDREPAGLGPEGGLDDPNIETLSEAGGPPQAFGFESDLYCSGFIGDLDEPLPIAIAGSEHQAYGPALSGIADMSIVRGNWGDLDTTKYGLDLGDIVYLDGGRAEGLQPGDLLSAVAPGPKVHHPLTRDTVGRLYGSLGRVRVLTVADETAIGEIAHVCDPIPVGSRLRPFQAEPVPLGRRSAPRPPNDPTTAAALQTAPVIVMARDGILSLGEDHLVYIDRGADADSTPGDVYTIYRLNTEGFPPVPVGELAVLSVSRRTSLARILSSRLPIFVGDRLERKIGGEAVSLVATRERGAVIDAPTRWRYSSRLVSPIDSLVGEGSGCQADSERSAVPAGR